MASEHDSPARCADSAPPYGTIAFDCDSTLSAIEGIDELAAIAGVTRESVERLTAQAMAGELALEEVYARRLELVRPTRDHVDALGRRYVETALPSSRELIAGLRALSKRVCIVTGGLRQAVLALAEHLAVDPADVFAVEVYHDRSGVYAGFDELSPLARAGGKLDVLRDLARLDHAGGLAFVGDGATDLEAAPAARRFVAFAGFARRQAVLARAAVTCSRRDLAALLPLLVSRGELDELASLPEHAALVRAARAAAP